MSRFPECAIFGCGLSEFLEIDHFSVFLETMQLRAPLQYCRSRTRRYVSTAPQPIAKRVQQRSTPILASRILLASIGVDLYCTLLAMGYGAVDTYLLVRLRQYCNGARSCMVSKNTEKWSISRNSLSPQPKMAHSGKRDMSGFPIYSPSSLGF